MAISLNLNRLCGFHVIRFEGRVTFDQLVQLGRLHQSLPSFAAADAIHIIDPDADVSALTPAHIDAMREHYAKLQRGIDFYMIRRAAWVCATAQACRIVEHWLAGRHSRDGQGTEVCLAANLAGTAPLFSEEEVAAVENWSNFTELARIDGDALDAVLTSPSAVFDDTQNGARGSGSTRDVSGSQSTTPDVETPS